MQLQVNAARLFPGIAGTVQVGMLNITGAQFTVANSANKVPLTINQNDTTNNLGSIIINHSGTGIAVRINNSTGNPGVHVAFGGTTGGGNNVGGFFTQSTTATSAAAFNMVWNSSGFTGVAGYGVCNIRQTHASATGPNLIVEQAGTGKAIFLNNDNTGLSLHVDHDYNSASDTVSVQIDPLNAGAGKEIALDLSTVPTDAYNLKIAATADTPTVSWGLAAGNMATTTPAGYMKINVGGSARYMPFWV